MMSDKGFNVQDIFVPYHHPHSHMRGDTVLRDRKLTSKRVHVERFIGLAKIYKILAQSMNSSETQLASDIVFICFMLCNFRSGIVSKTACHLGQVDYTI